MPGEPEFEVDHVRVPNVGSGHQPEMVEHILINEPKVVGIPPQESIHGQPATAVEKR
jgi:hypothetical protein